MLPIIVVTGGAGFVGSNLVAELVRRNSHRIVVCDTMGTGNKWRNLAHHPIYEIVPPERMMNWLEANKSAIEIIFHLGGISSSVEPNVDLLLEQNFTTSLKLWRWCLLNSKRMIYASAAHTYGGGEHGFVDDQSMEYLSRLKPLSGFAWSKHLFDLHTAGAASRKEPAPAQWVGLKFFNIYGPNEYHKDTQVSVVLQISKHALQGGSVKLFKSYRPDYPDGGQKRDFIYVRDCVKLMLWLLDHPKVSGLFNCGSGTARTFDDLAHAIFAALARKPNIHYVDMPEGLAEAYQYFTEANMEKLRAAGYTEPFMSLEDGVKDYVQNYLSKPDPYL